MRRKDPKVKAKWRAHFTAFRRSNLTVTAYCRQAGISESAFYRRRQELEPRARRQAAPSRSARPSATSHENKQPFVPVAVAPIATAEIELPGGIRIRAAATDRPTLATVIRAALDAQEERT